MERPKLDHWPARLGNYLLIPHELLHVVGFWLVGKRCQYRWGQPYVTPIDPMLRWQRLVGRLFPFAVFSTLTLILSLLAGFASRQVVVEGRLFWFFFWLLLMQISALYVGTTLIDLRNAYLLIFNKPWHSHTPFDLFFWPVVDWEDVRHKANLEESHVEQD